MRKSRQILTAKIGEMGLTIHEMTEELVELYELLYPDVLVNSKSWLLPLPTVEFKLGALRNYHKEQLEKEKMKNLIKECMGEIKQ